MLSSKTQVLVLGSHLLSEQLTFSACLSGVQLAEHVLNDPGKIKLEFRITWVSKALKAWYIYAPDSWCFQKQSSSHPAEGKYLSPVLSTFAQLPEQYKLNPSYFGLFILLLPNPTLQVPCRRNAGLILFYTLPYGLKTVSRVFYFRVVTNFSTSRSCLWCEKVSFVRLLPHRKEVVESGR